MADLPPVKISLVAEGFDGIKTAFQDIESAAKKLEESLTRLHKSGATKRSNETKREEQERSRTASTEAKKREAAKEREFAALSRTAEKWRREEIAAEKRKNAAIEAEARRSAAARDRFFKNVGSRTVSGVQRGIGTAIGLAGQVAAVGGGFGIVDSLSKAVKNQGLAKQIAIQSEGKVTKEQVYQQAQKVANVSGFSTEESLKALDKFTEKAGYDQLEKVMQIMPQLADLADATGASFEDVAEAAGLAFGNDKTQSAEQLMQTMRKLAAQGRAGALDMRDLAGSLGRITATARQFSGDVNKNISTLGGFAQLSMQKGTSVSKDEATEAVKSLSHDIAENKHKFAGLGVETQDQYGQLKDPRTIVAQAVTATRGNQTQLQKLFGLRSFRGIEGYARTFQDAYAGARKKGKSDTEAAQVGLDAANKILDEFTKAEISREQLKKEAADRRTETDKRLDIEFNKLRDEVGDKLVPKLRELIPKIAELTPQLIKLLDAVIKMGNWAAENPWKAAFAALTALMLKEAGAALTAEFFKKMLTTNMSVGGLPTGGAGAPGFNLGTAGAITIGAAAGITIGNLITNGLDDLSKTRQKARNEEGAEVNKAFFALSGGKAGSVEEAEKLIQKIKDESGGGSKYFEKTHDEMEQQFMKGNYMASFLSFLDTQLIYRTGPNEEQQKSIDALQKAIDEYKKTHTTNTDNSNKATQANTTATQQLTVAIQNAKTPGPPPPPTYGNPQVGDFGGAQGGARSGSSGTF